jgi:hypothetical protein
MVIYLTNFDLSISFDLFDNMFDFHSTLIFSSLSGLLFKVITLSMLVFRSLVYIVLVLNSGAE